MIKLHKTSDITQNMINALRLCYILTHFIGLFSNKVENSVLTKFNWIYIFSYSILACKNFKSKRKTNKEVPNDITETSKIFLRIK